MILDKSKKLSLKDYLIRRCLHFDGIKEKKEQIKK